MVDFIIQYPDSIDMLGPRGPNVGGPHLLRWPNNGNLHRPKANLKVGSTLDQHDGSTLGQHIFIMV